MTQDSFFALRRVFHQELSANILSVRAEQSVRGTRTPVYSNADRHSELSVDLAARMADRMPSASAAEIGGTAAGRAFERTVEEFVAKALAILPQFSLWPMKVEPGRLISHFAQYAHLEEIQSAVRQTPELEATLGGDYLVKPDLVVSWRPLTSDEIGSAVQGNDDCDDSEEKILSPSWTPFPGLGLPILHASISCKWTIRSDRVQNTRTEALNLVRNRKGRTPHIVAVTMEPHPGRLASIAIGTGDIDCVYHGALSELREAAREGAVERSGAWVDAQGRLEMMVQSRRLRDIGDLPLDLLA